ncbi:peptide/nickel transport system ATP-binding protein [Microbacterium halimionae]|uniref:Peptide/nickel transport system ATP-binding protein n=1 Tax=Microbacterium halimionae TaxID=1526413 RepID=A0A7W3JRD4_9MICO|nr:ABC transporter ATP-binding protein [Microbacterium halimionae]MBA8817622.1 peptide/nickel transport system ATP-binding protein [Microbacterium halimionae]NII94332.1 peptide/nickel transport system ATP-binding protein [Microbacterium halimionae]
MNVLDISGLTVRAGDSTLVDNISFVVKPGERVGIIGESGSGKSITSLAALGLLADSLVATGSVRIEGREVIGTPDHEIRRLRGPAAQIVFQEPLTALDPLMRVERQIAEPLRRHLHLHGAALRDAVREALAEVSLTEPRIARAYPFELSGGQRQRVAIAIALAAHPRILIADEPTTALDVTVQDGVLTLLERLATDRGMALLFISHDLAVVSRMVERLIVMRDGVAVEEGDVRAVLSTPKHPYTAALVASARALDAAWDAATPGTERESS